MKYEWPGFLIIFVFGFLVATGPLSYYFPRRLRYLIILAFLLRPAAVLLRYWVIFDFYGGGDALGYFRNGLFYADSIWSMDFSFLEPSRWEGKWWGTNVVNIISGFILSLIGPSIRGEFLFFSLLSLCALLLFCKSFLRNYPFSNYKHYAAWILFWPSLWFWGSSVGKDVLVLLSGGLVVYGYAGKTEKISWIPLFIGLFLAAIIRPHVAGVFIVSIAIAHWITPGARWNAAHWMQGVGIILLTILVLQYSFKNLQVGDIDVDSMKEYVDSVSYHSEQGGSAISAPGLSLIGLPLAFVNILFRPFPWEVGNPLMAAAALELAVFWTMVFVRRRRILGVAVRWRDNRLLRLSVPLTLLYILMLGMAVANLGIIARQRIHILPLLFIWLEALPYRESVSKKAESKSRLLQYPPGNIQVPKRATL